MTIDEVLEHIDVFTHVVRENDCEDCVSKASHWLDYYLNLLETQLSGELTWQK